MTNSDHKKTQKKQREMFEEYQRKIKELEKMLYEIEQDQGPDLYRPELDDRQIESLSTSLREHFKKIAGLETPGLGQYCPGKSMPRFKAVTKNKRFVQIINTYDHWICTTNVFTNSSHKIYAYIFDSLQQKSVSATTIVQLSSLLRSRESDDETLTCYVRRFHAQPLGSRMCGLLAVAAMYACCNGVDPTGCTFDEDQLALAIGERMSKTDITSIIQPSEINTEDDRNIYVFKADKLYCFCQRPCADKELISCSECGNWYHVECVTVHQRALKSIYHRWSGPCCRSITEEDELICLSG